MRPRRLRLILCILLTASSMTANGARAMEISEFYKMSGADRLRYDRSLIAGTIKLLESEGKRQDAAKMVILFVEEEGKLVPAGMAAYQNNLVTARELGSERGVNQNRFMRSTLLSWQ